MRPTAIPTELLETGRGVIRPRDAASVYGNPAAELKRLEKRGALFRLGRGYYAVVPEGFRRSAWRPGLEAAALGIGVADYGIDGAVLMGLSAARLHGAVPRAIGRAWVAVDAKRPTKSLAMGSVAFVFRGTNELDAVRMQTELGSGLVTSPTQTALDLADRPDDWAGSPAHASEAIWSLLPRIDWNRARRLAEDQRRRPAFVRLRWLGSSADSTPTGRLGRGVVPSLGLRHPERLDPQPFGVQP